MDNRATTESQRNDNNGPIAGPSRIPSRVLNGASIDLTADTDDEDDDGDDDDDDDRPKQGHSGGRSSTGVGSSSTPSNLGPSHPRASMYYSNQGQGDHGSSSNLFPTLTDVPMSTQDYISSRGSPGGPSARGQARDDIQVTGNNLSSPSRPSQPTQYSHHNMPAYYSSPYHNPSAPPPPYYPSSSSLLQPASTSFSLGPTHSESSMGDSAASAIDLTQARLPSPSPASDSKRPVCIGSIQSRAIMLYPSPAAIVGAGPPPGAKESFQTVMYMGAELLKVKLKVVHRPSQIGMMDDG